MCFERCRAFAAGRRKRRSNRKTRPPRTQRRTRMILRTKPKYQVTNNSNNSNCAHTTWKTFVKNDLNAIALPDYTRTLEIFCYVVKSMRRCERIHDGNWNAMWIASPTLAGTRSSPAFAVVPSLDSGPDVASELCFRRRAYSRTLCERGIKFYWQSCNTVTRVECIRLVVKYNSD